MFQEKNLITNRLAGIKKMVVYLIYMNALLQFKGVPLSAAGPRKLKSEKKVYHDRNSRDMRRKVTKQVSNNDKRKNAAYLPGGLKGKVILHNNVLFCCFQFIRLAKCVRYVT